MAKRRMFSRDVVETDAFMGLKISAQTLYFHLGMNADDDGFVGNPLAIANCIGAPRSDIKLLEDAGYIISLNKGVIVIRDWLLNNRIRKDRYTPTVYQELFEKLSIDRSGRYTICQPDGNQMVYPGKDSIDKDSIEERSIENMTPEQQPTKRFCPPSVSEVKDYCIENGYAIDPEGFIDYYEANGWKVGRNPIGDRPIPDFANWANELSNGGALS